MREIWRVFTRKVGFSLKLGIPLIAAAAGLIFDYMFWQGVDGGFADGMRVLVCVLAGVWLALVFYLFPLAARMDMPAGTAYRNGILLVFKYLPQTMYLLFITGVFFVAGLLWTPVFGAGMLAGGSLTAMVHGKMLIWIFEKELGE